MRRYETVVIAQANLPEEEMTSLIDRYSSIITDRKGAVIKIDRWGVRKLAYDIKKQSRGAYVLYDFAATSDVVVEMERNLKIDDSILKFMTVMTDPETNPEKIMKEISALTKKETVAEKSEVTAEASTEAPVNASSPESGTTAGNNAPSATTEE